MFEKILIATDGSKHSERAAKAGIALAKLSGGKVAVVYVADISRYMPTGGLIPPFGGVSPYAIDEVVTDLRKVVLEEGERATRHVEELARESNIPSETMIIEGHPATEILKLAKEATMDIIVMGSIGKTGLVKFLMGSVAEKVVRNSKVPVLIVHGD